MAAFLGVATLAVAAAARTQQSAPEYQLKALFLYRFANFVEWPADVLPTNRPSPIVIGVLGADPFGNYLNRFADEQKVNGHPFVVKPCREVGDGLECQILFISKSETRHLGAILRDLRRKSILTVGESEHFARDGGMIQFIEIGGRIRFTINQSAARAARLKISSQLLKLATVVY